MGLLGENGAGKSTLVKILGGLHEPESGEILMSGKRVNIGTPRRSREVGIAVAAQELSVIESLSVAENIFIAGVPFKGPWSLGRLAIAARPYLDAVGLTDMDPRVSIESLSIANRQLIEIARLLARDARILVLDEPTAALPDSDIEIVKSTVKRLAAQGLSLVYVTHRLGEVFDIADRVTVLRNGRSLPPKDIGDCTMDLIVRDIVGRPLHEMYPPKADGPGDVVLTVDDLLCAGLSQPVSFKVRAGEILGLAGQTGSGNGLVLQAIAGVLPTTGGRVEVGGKSLAPAHTLAASIHAGIGYCSGDRKLDGIFQGLSVTTNLTAPSLKLVSQGPWISSRKEDHLARELAHLFAIDSARLPHRAMLLSGGNQQKVALGKWLGPSPTALLVEEPTRGVDVGARAEIYGHLRTLARQGMAIVFASSDLDEVHGLSDRIGTLFRGSLVRITDAESITKTDLLHDVTHADTAHEPTGLRPEKEPEVVE
jgi:ABC-type sugar transport system ATPase subunit